MRSACPIAGTLEIIGDKWTLLIVRDMMMFGRTRFSEFLDAGEGITTNILTDRLKRLEAHNLVRREPYQAHPTRYIYVLTPDGEALEPILREMITWGLDHVEGSGR